MTLGRKPANPEMAEKALVWEFFDFSTEGFFVEVGANHPTNLSQTWLLEQMGWRGILVEPLPDRCEELRRHRPRSTVREVAVSAPDKTGEADFHVLDALSSLDRNVINARARYDAAIRVRVVTLDSVLEESAVDRIDFLSIDTEGTELDVLRGLDLDRYRPRLLLLEDLLHSLEKHRHLARRRYRLVRRTGNNSWYVPDGSPFSPSLGTRLRLFRKVWLGTPFRSARFRRERERAGLGAGPGEAKDGG